MSADCSSIFALDWSLFTHSQAVGVLSLTIAQVWICDLFFTVSLSFIFCLLRPHSQVMFEPAHSGTDSLYHSVCWLMLTCSPLFSFLLESVCYYERLAHFLLSHQLFALCHFLCFSSQHVLLLVRHILHLQFSRWLFYHLCFQLRSLLSYDSYVQLRVTHVNTCCSDLQHDLPSMKSTAQTSVQHFTHIPRYQRRRRNPQIFHRLMSDCMWRRSFYKPKQRRCMKWDLSFSNRTETANTNETCANRRIKSFVFKIMQTHVNFLLN